VDVSDCIALIRFLLLLASIGFFLRIYSRLRFKGFITLVAAFIFSAITLALIELGVIQATGPRYEILLLVVAVMFLVSSYWLYRALVDFRKVTKDKKQQGRGYSER
jgi:hypothetical protein